MSEVCEGYMSLRGRGRAGRANSNCRASGGGGEGAGGEGDDVAVRRNIYTLQTQPAKQTQTSATSPTVSGRVL